MAISYVWDVSNCDAYPTKSGKSNVVTCVHWRLKAIDGSNNDSDGNPHIAEVYGAQHLDTSDLSSFTNFSNLTTSDVQGWVETALTSDKITEMKAGLDAEIASKVSPDTVAKLIAS